jgi:transposase-like protein
MATFHFPPETKARARAMYAQGAKLSEVAKAVGAGQTTVWRWLESAGETQAPRHYYSVRDVRAVLARIDAGEKPLDVARETGVHPSTIWRWIEERDTRDFAARVFGSDRRARYAIQNPVRALAISGAWR